MSACTNFYWMMYVSFCSITLTQLDRSRIPFSQNVLNFSAKNRSRWVLMASGFEEFFPLREFWRRDDNPMEQGQDYMEGAAKHPRKTRVVFCGCTKMCLARHCRDRRFRPSCWPILSASAERPPLNDRVARSIRRHRWFGSLGAAHNKLLPWYLTRCTESSFSGKVRL